MQAGELAVGVEAGGKLALRDRPIEVVGLVLLAAPDQLDRDAGEFLGDRHRLMHVVLRAAAPAEAAAEVVAVDFALGERNARGLRQRRERRFEVLRRHPALGLVGRELHGGVHHLHAGVGEERRRIDRLDLLRRLVDGLQRIAVLALAVGRCRGEALLELLGDARARDVAVAGLVPDDGQRVERLLGAPPGVGHHGNAGVLDLHHLLHAGHSGDLALVEALQLAAEHRAVLDRGAQHARQLEVDRVDLAAVELVGGVEPLQRLAGDGPVLRVLELDGLRIGRRHLGRCRRDLAVAGLALARRVGDDALRHGELGDRHLPLVGRRLQQHDARRRAAAPHVVLRRADAAAAAGAHLAPGALARKVAPGRDAFGRDLAPVALQLFGDELREAGERALPHLRARDADDAGVVGLDRDPDVDLVRRAVLRLARTARSVRAPDRRRPPPPSRR